MRGDVKAVVLAGGQGTRFWPVSRSKTPKQFLSISEKGESLISATARRALAIAGPENVWVVTNVLHRDQVAEHVPGAHILCEPVGKNTAPSIGLAAVRLRKSGGDPVMVVLPADHAVKDEAVLTDVLNEAVAAARERELLVTVGIAPTSPHTGYGYIRRGEKIKGAASRSFEVGRFYEKPSMERAQKYVESGEYFWNGGIFVWRASVILKAFEAHMPELYRELSRIEEALDTPHESMVMAECFAKLDSVSIDFGVLEHARNCAVIVAPPFGWDDVGSWESWAQHFATDAQQNLCHGDVLVLEGERNVLYSKNRFMAVLGVDDLVVIDAGDAMLVCPRSRAQDVRKVVAELRKKGRTELM